MVFMTRFSVVMFTAFFVGGAYSYLMGKFFKNKIILFLPTILAFAWLFYVVATFKRNNVGGFYDLAIFISGMIIFTVVLGNIVSYLIFNNKNK